MLGSFQSEPERVDPAVNPCRAVGDSWLVMRDADVQVVLTSGKPTKGPTQLQTHQAQRPSGERVAVAELAARRHRESAVRSNP